MKRPISTLVQMENYLQRLKVSSVYFRVSVSGFRLSEILLIVLKICFINLATYPRPTSGRNPDAPLPPRYRFQLLLVLQSSWGEPCWKDPELCHSQPLQGALLPTLKFYVDSSEKTKRFEESKTALWCHSERSMERHEIRTLWMLPNRLLPEEAQVSRLPVNYVYVCTQ